MRAHLKQLGSDTAIYGLSTMAGRFINYLLVPLYGHLFLTSENGVIGLVYAAFVFLNILYTYGLESSYLKFASGANREKAPAAFSTVFWCLFISSVAFSILMIALAKPLARTMTLEPKYYYAVSYMAGILFLDTVMTAPMAELRLARRAWVFAGIRLLNVGLNVTLNAALILRFHWRVEAVFFSNLVASASTVILSTICTRALFTGRFDRALLRAMLRFGLPYVPTGIGYAITESMDRFFLARMPESAIERLYGPGVTAQAVVGVYSNCYKLGVFMLLFVQMFRFAWQPFFLQIQDEPGANKVFARAFTLFSAIGALVVLGVSFYAHPLARLVFGPVRYPEYAVGMFIVPIILTAYLAQGWYTHFTAGVFIRSRTRDLPWITLIGAVITLAANLILTPRYGMAAAAWATLVSYLVMAAALGHVSNGVYPVPLRMVEARRRRCDCLCSVSGRARRGRGIVLAEGGTAYRCGGVVLRGGTVAAGHGEKDSGTSMKTTDIHVRSVALYFLPVTMRVPLKFGAETLTSVTCARVRVTVEDARGAVAEGWGETPLSVGWVWPSAAPYDERHEALQTFCIRLAQAWAHYSEPGHPIEIGHTFTEDMLSSQLDTFNAQRGTREHLPWLAALVCCSPFDIAVHDAYGNLHGRPVYETYTAEFMNQDLAHWLRPADGSAVKFCGLYPADFFQRPAPARLAAWHLVGGKDPIDAGELDGTEPDDGYPTLLTDWIVRDGLTCLKIKLRGNDAAWDYARIVKVGQLAEAHAVTWLSVDFNCMVQDPAYVTEILDRLMGDCPAIYGRILYVEQPFPYDLERYQLDVHSVSARKPLFMDESAHDWHLLRLGRSLGWSGVALKTCKTPDRRSAQPVLGQGPRHDPHGAGPHQPHAGADPARRAGRARRHHHGRRDQQHAVLSRGVTARSGSAPRALPAPERNGGLVQHFGKRLWLSPGGDPEELAPTRRSL